MLQRADLVMKWLALEPRLATGVYYRRTGDSAYQSVSCGHLGVRNTDRHDLQPDPRIGVVEIVISLWADDGGGITWQPGGGDRVDLVSAGDLSNTRWIVAPSGVERKLFGTHWHLHCERRPGG